MTQAILTTAPSFTDLAFHELHRLHPKTKRLAEVAEGVWLFSFSGPYEALGRRWFERPPIYVHHLCPVHARVPLSCVRLPGGGALSPVYRELKIRLMRRIRRSQRFTVQVRVLGGLPYHPRDIEASLTELVRDGTGARWHPERAEQVLSVVFCPLEGAPTALLGISQAAHNVSPWNGGIPRFLEDAERLNRAESKLREALCVFGLRFSPGEKALDLGAAPGGWTRVLRQQGLCVTAVDPRALSPALLDDPQVQHEAMTAESYLARGPGAFDFLTNDMRLDPRDAARLMVSYAHHLRPRGMAVMTLKLRQENRLKLMDHAFRILRKTYTIKRVRHLYFNKSEVTLWLKRRE